MFFSLQLTSLITLPIKEALLDVPLSINLCQFFVDHREVQLEIVVIVIQMCRW